MSRPVFELGDTIQFTLTTSVAPDSAPTFKITGATGTVVASITSIQSATTSFYAFYTIPNTEGSYIGEWAAVKTFQGSVYPFVKRFAFNASQLRRQ